MLVVVVFFICILVEAKFSRHLTHETIENIWNMIRFEAIPSIRIQCVRTSYVNNDVGSVFFHCALYLLKSFQCFIKQLYFRCIFLVTWKKIPNSNWVSWTVFISGSLKFIRLKNTVVWIRSNTQINKSLSQKNNIHYLMQTFWIVNHFFFSFSYGIAFFRFWLFGTENNYDLVVKTVFSKSSCFVWKFKT